MHSLSAMYGIIKNDMLNISSILNKRYLCVAFCADFTLEYIQREGLRDPIIFKKADGLGIKYGSFDHDILSLLVSLSNHT